MTNLDHSAIISYGVEGWNKWRRSNPEIFPRLFGINLSSMNLSGIDFSNTDLRFSKLNQTDLSNAKMYQAECYKAELRDINLKQADLRGAKFHDTDMRGANLKYANLFRVDFINTRLDGASFNYANCSTTAFANIDLSDIIGLDQVLHIGPSNIDVATLYNLKKPIPNTFLRGAGVPDDLIEFMLSLLKKNADIRFHSCFISYSHKDEEFAKLLHSRMESEQLRVWFAPADMVGGAKIYEQIERAIQQYDKLLVILSKDSIKSQWVTTELYRARQLELEHNRRIIFPIRIVGFEEIRKWKCFHADSGKDLAGEIREYFIPDFTEWKNNQAFEKAFERLSRALREA